MVPPVEAPGLGEECADPGPDAALANGFCERRGGPAPFARADGTPYLEPHHVRRLAAGGPDDPRWVAACCPT